MKKSAFLIPFLLILVLFNLNIFNINAQDEKNIKLSLEEQLLEQAKMSEKRMSKRAKEIIDDSIRDLSFSGDLDNALQPGDNVPDFTLKTCDNKFRSLNNLLSKKYLVLVFYRGGWCPYCDIYLRNLDLWYPEIKQAGAELAAISPQIPEESIKTKNEGNLSIPILYDEQNKLAKKFGIAYTIPEDVLKVYNGFKIDLEKQNNYKEKELPVTSVFIADSNGKIIYRHIEPDYRERLDAKKIIKILKNIN